MPVHTHTHTQTHTHTHTHTHTTHTHTHTHTQIHTYMYIYTHTYIYMYIIYTYTYIHIHIGGTSCVAVWRMLMLTYADVMLTYADVCRWHFLCWCLAYADADVCWCNADVCWRMLTYAGGTSCVGVSALESRGVDLRASWGELGTLDQHRALEYQRLWLCQHYRRGGTSVWGLKLLVYEALSY
jgi:hypothetical protein